VTDSMSSYCGQLKRRLGQARAPSSCRYWPPAFVYNCYKARTARELVGRLSAWSAAALPLAIGPVCMLVVWPVLLWQQLPCGRCSGSVCSGWA
jgi:hypothetical protein